MTRFVARATLTACLVLGVGLPAVAQQASEDPAAEEPAAEEPTADEAADDGTRRRDSKWKRKEKGPAADKRYTPGPRFYKQYQAGAQAYGEEDYKLAIKLLDRIPMKRATPYERTLRYQLLAFSFYADDQQENARKALTRAVEANGFPPDQQSTLHFQLAKLHAAAQQWDDVISTLNTWFELEQEPGSGAYNLMALAYFQKNEYDKAVAPAQKAYDLMEVPNEGWIRLLLALRLTRQEFKEAIPLLERLVADFPKKTYWMQLSTVHGATGSYENALVPLQLAYAQDLLTEDPEIRRLAQLLMFLELPYRAAEALELGLEEGIVQSDVDGWEMLSNSWIAAREYDSAVAPLEKAADLDPTGDLYVRLAQVHIQREKWKDAIAALDAGIAKGDLAKPCDALILMGIAHYSAKAPARARGWFARAGGYADCRDESATWVTFIDRELQTLAAQQEQQGTGAPAGGGEAEAPGADDASDSAV